MKKNIGNKLALYTTPVVVIGAEVNGEVCSVSATYASDEVLLEGDKLDYTRLRPVLFEIPTYQYLRTGDVIVHCTDAGKTYRYTHNQI